MLSWLALQLEELNKQVAMCGRKAEDPTQALGCGRGLGPPAMGLLQMEELDTAWEGWTSLLTLFSSQYSQVQGNSLAEGALEKP